MTVQVTSNGTRGAFFPAPVLNFLNPAIFRVFRNGRFAGTRILVLTTVGARSGKVRRTTLGYFPEDENAWLIVGSAGGRARHPAWVFNLAKNPDQVWIQVGDRKLKVKPESLEGAAREVAYRRISSEAPAYAAYPSKTDRQIPVIRLTPA